MDRKAFITSGLACGLGLGGVTLLPPCCGAVAESEERAKVAEDLGAVSGQLAFVRNWVGDLMETMGRRLDEQQVVALMEGCGEGCYRRFKTFLTREADGDLDKLINLYNTRWAGPGSVVRAGDTIEVRYRMAGCSCPVAQHRPHDPGEMHCHCSKGSVKAIFSTVAGRPLQVDLVQSIRRGDPLCRFVVHL